MKDIREKGRGVGRKQLLNFHIEKKIYWNLKEEALYPDLSRTRIGRCYVAAE
jgi:hypothetical protein